MQQLDDVKGVDLSVTAEDVRQAEREATEARELRTELERQAVEAPAAERPEAAEITERRALAEFAARRVKFTRQRAREARAARRLLDLAEVGGSIDALAAEAVTRESGDSITQAIRKIAQSASVLRELCAQHDRAVEGIVRRALELGAEESSPSGPRATSAHVALVRSIRQPPGAQHGRTRVMPVGKRAAEAAALAAAGDPDKALALVGAVHQQPPVTRADRYFRSISGAIVAESGPQSPGFTEQERDGRLVRLTDDEVDRYLEGVLDDGDNS